jgi:orotidine-5'-phosphate decarboxylase
MVRRVAPEAGVLKVGLEAFVAEGPALVREVVAAGAEVFLDLKLHDIPNTMVMALRSLSRLPVGLCTLHIPAGPEAMRACAAEVQRIADTEGPAIGLLGVTRLTSLSPPDLTDPWQDVVSLAGEAVACGIYGWIAPSAAAPLLRRAHGRGPVLVCPGIRLPEQAKQDQVAVGTPEDAVRGGADWIVVGRPITRADDPPGAARDIARRLV